MQQNWKEVLTERERDCLLCWEDKDIPSLFEMSHSFLLQTSSSLFNLRAILTLHKASQSVRQAGRQAGRQTVVKHSQCCQGHRTSS
jgi:hypothetical protein